MTKHRTITGFVAVALVAVAATAVTMRSHSPWADGIVVSSTTLLKGIMVSNEAPPANFDDRWSAISALPSREEPQASR
jgi:predicted anti-sigma-YlaC factor YlaD